MKKQTILSLTLVAFCLLFILIAVKFSGDVNKSLTTGGQCTLQDNVCQFVDDIGVFSVIFNQQPQIEEELQLKINLSEDLLLTKAWVEGANMYMGKTPVIPSSKVEYDIDNNRLDAKDSFQGVLFLGSCTEPRMQWIMYIDVLNTNTNVSRIYKVFFNTSTS